MKLHAAVFQYADKLIVLGTDKNGVVNVLADQLYTGLARTPGMLEHASKFTGVIVDLCMFGSLVRKGVRY